MHRIDKDAAQSPRVGAGPVRKRLPTFSRACSSRKWGRRAFQYNRPCPTHLLQLEPKAGWLIAKLAMPSRLRGKAEIRLQGAEALWETLLCLIIGHRRDDDHVLAL